MFNVAVGHSDNFDSKDAAEEILAQCALKLGEAIPQAGILFAGMDYDHQGILDQIGETHPDLELVGCTTDGETSSVMGFGEDSITLMLLSSDTVSINAGIGFGVVANPKEAASSAVLDALSKSDKKAGLCITVPEGLGTNSMAVIDSLNETLGSGVPVVGGMSGDQMRFTQTYQFFNGKVFSDSIPVLVFSGDFLCSYGVATGWNPLGDKHLVTEATGNVIMTIDGKPAKDLYTRYLNDHSVHYPLAVYPQDDEHFYLSTPTRFDDDGSIVCQNTVRTGSHVRLSEATRDEIISGAALATQAAIDGYPGSNPAGGIIFSCAGRKAALGTRTVEEITLFTEELSSDIHIGGFYTYGEICPLPNSEFSQSHNCAFVTVLIGES